MSVKPDKVVDLRGYYCPEPIFRATQEIDLMKTGQVLEVLADDPAAEADFDRWTKRTGNPLLEVRKEGRVFHFIVRKG